jgi:hypothetical protein
VKLNNWELLQIVYLRKGVKKNQNGHTLFNGKKKKSEVEYLGITPNSLFEKRSEEKPKWPHSF